MTTRDANSRWLGVLVSGALLMGAAGVGAQSYTPGYAPAPPVIPNTYGQAPAYSADQLDEMLGPIALYPDPLLSQILAAATYPQDIAAAGQWVQTGVSLSEDDINEQAWDPSVKALAHFPNVIQMMAGQMDWTQALGYAFINQQQEVMDAVQRLRVRAQQSQVLASTPQQNVVQENGAIQIIPAQPDVIYVPQYDPGLVYGSGYIGGPGITFGSAFPFGSFFDLGIDFSRHRFVRGVVIDRDRRRYDFDRVEPWRRDVRRPIPPPVRTFVPPRTPDVRRGWDDGDRRTNVFRPAPGRVESPPGRVGAPPGRVGPPPGRVNAPPGNVSERVITIPRPPERARPAPSVTPARPVQPRVEQPRETFRVPGRGAPPQMIQPSTGRPVTGLPPRAATVQRATPVPVQRQPGAAQARPAPTVQRSPAFSPGAGGARASERGNGSLRR